MRRALEPCLGGNFLHEHSLLKRGSGAGQTPFGQPRSGRLSELKPQDALQMPLADSAVLRQRGNSVAGALRPRLPIGDAVQPASAEYFSPHIAYNPERLAGAVNIVHNGAAMANTDANGRIFQNSFFRA